jgi:hypothetical protein
MRNSDDDNDLTSLAWLHNVTISLPADAETTSTSSALAASTATSELNRRLLEISRDATVEVASASQKPAKSRSSASRAQPTANSKRKLLVHQRTNVSQLLEQHRLLRSTHDYAGDAAIKPPFSYAALICLAMSEADSRMSLSQIYKWIKENFAYYRHGDKSWQVNGGRWDCALSANRSIGSGGRLIVRLFNYHIVIGLQITDSLYLDMSICSKCINR